MKKIEDLGLLNLKVYQDDELYCFTSDSVMLAKFARAKKGDVVADFCSGSGIVGFYYYGLNQKTVKSVTFFELQKPMFDLSVESIKENGLEDIFNAVNLPLQQIGCEYNEKFSLILCNPPYMAKDSGEHDKSGVKAVCRREVALSLEELITAISRALKFGGRVCMVHRADRLVDVMCTMRAHGVEPKRLQMVGGGAKPPYLFMIEAVKGGKSSLEVLSETQN